MNEAFTIWQLRLRLGWLLRTTGFKHYWDSSSRDYTETVTRRYEKSDFSIVIKSYAEYGGRPRSSISVSPDFEPRRITPENLLEAIRTVETTFPKDKPRIAAFILKPIGIKMLIGISVILIWVLILNGWIFTTELLSKQSKFVQSLIAPIIVFVCGIFVIFANTERIFIRIALIIALLGGVSAYLFKVVF